MLIEFCVENLFCFGTEVQFSLIASTDDKHPSHLIEKSEGKSLKLLRCSGVYGANNHGKTKLVEAMRVLRSLVTEGVKADAKIPVRPFRLSANLEKAPTKFNIKFHASGADYEYGIVVNRERIFEEWLFMRRKTKEVAVFERVVSEAGASRVKFGASIKKEYEDDFLQFLAKSTRKNQPFLREAIERNVSYLDPINKWFSRTLTIISAVSYSAPLHGVVRKDSEFLEFLGNFLKKAGTGIESVELEEKEIRLDELSDNLPSEIMDLLKDTKSEEHMIILEDREGPIFAICQDSGGEISGLRLKTIHRSSTGKKVSFPLEEESAGTRRLAQLIPMLVDLVSNDRVFIVDEIDRKLHPLLAYEFLRYYLEHADAKTRSQLVFTTHNTHILDLKLLRRDEVWFVEKDKSGESKLYSLVNLKVRPDLDTEKGYLRGRFGAVPFFGNLSDLGW